MTSSAPGDRRDECDLVAVLERCRQRRVYPVDGHRRLCRQPVEGSATASQVLHEVSHRRAVRKVQLEAGRAEEVSVGGEEEGVNRQ
jgi:hypothetical protein